jgi:DNA uptake protein ComE-like DNA-binding protein
MKISRTTLTSMVAAVLLTGALTGCTDAMDGDESTLKNQSFLAASSGKADSIFNIQPDSVEANGVLKLANNASFETLDSSAQVGLDIRAAENIVETRQTSELATLKQLDKIAWVSQRAFRKLYDYAESNGYFGEDSTGTSNDSVYGVEPGSNLAEGILNVANNVDLETLDNADGVGLDIRAAENIVETRQSSKISTLTELDTILWVDSRAFDKLLSYAQSHNYVPTDATDGGDDSNNDNDSYRRDKRDACYTGRWSSKVLCP